jgi:hypothetical protein
MRATQRIRRRDAPPFALTVEALHQRGIELDELAPSDAPLLPTDEAPPFMLDGDGRDLHPSLGFHALLSFRWNALARCAGLTFPIIESGRTRHSRSGPDWPVGRFR